MDIAVFGGSFDPPHVGHALVISWLRWTNPGRPVYIIPTFKHALGKDSSPFDDRVLWCQAMADVIDPSGVTVLPIERELSQPTYTINMLRALTDVHPQHRFRLVVGSDILLESPLWHRWDEIEREFSPIIVGRQGYAHYGNTPLFPAVSSTEIRGRLATGKPVDHLVPAHVLDVMPRSRFIWAK